MKVDTFVCSNYDKCILRKDYRGTNTITDSIILVGDIYSCRYCPRGVECNVTVDLNLKRQNVRSGTRIEKSLVEMLALMKATAQGRKQ